MTRVRRRRALPLVALFASFCAGVLVDGALRTYGPPKPVQAVAQPAEPVVSAAPPAIVDRVVGPAEQPTMTAAPVAVTGVLPSTRLRVPIDGISIESFKGGFSALRGKRLHEAVDMVAPRGTPIHAVQDGTIARLFFSQRGGTTIYQFDAERRRCYYYAHLERYADGLHDGQYVIQGEVIGYVGTSGNAPPDTPHLHFAIFELDADGNWWHGQPLDPYLVFKQQAEDEGVKAPNVSDQIEPAKPGRKAGP